MSLGKMKNLHLLKRIKIRKKEIKLQQIIIKWIKSYVTKFYKRSLS